MKARITAAARWLVLYAFLALVGLLGGHIGAAAAIYTELGWTAMWLEISTWGPNVQPEPVSGRGSEAAG